MLPRADDIFSFADIVLFQSFEAIFNLIPKDIFLGPVWALSVGVYVRCERRDCVAR